MSLFSTLRQMWALAQQAAPAWPISDKAKDVIKDAAAVEQRLEQLAKTVKRKKAGTKSGK